MYERKTLRSYVQFHVGTQTCSRSYMKLCELGRQLVCQKMQPSSRAVISARELGP